MILGILQTYWKQAIHWLLGITWTTYAILIATYVKIKRASFETIQHIELMQSQVLRTLVYFQLLARNWLNI